MEIISALQSADKTKFHSLLQTLTNYSGGEFAYSSAKYKEYSAVSIITVLTRAAITGGVSPNDAYSISDILLYKTSLCRHEQEYMQVFRETLDSFFKLVKKNNDMQNQSIHIRDCKVYISHHLNKELSPDILAEHLGISKNYLLRLFPEYENMTLMQYILRERVMAAANMLKFSDFDIMRIATYFHFSDTEPFWCCILRNIWACLRPHTVKKINLLASKPTGLFMLFSITLHISPNTFVVNNA